jgi:hypothetical protein
MSKEEILNVIKLLSALESWCYSNQNKLPEALKASLTESIDILSREVLRD